MADRVLSSELEDNVSSPERPRERTKQRTKSRKRSSQSSSSRAPDPKKAKHSSAADKDASRRHKALERQFEKARSQSTQAAFTHLPTPLSPVAEDTVQPIHQATQRPLQSLYLPPAMEAFPEAIPTHCMEPVDLSCNAPLSRRPQPEATFTPTAAGLRAAESAPPPFQYDIQQVISDTVTRTLAATSHHAAPYGAWTQPRFPPPPPLARDSQPVPIQYQPTILESGPHSDYERGAESSPEEGEADPSDMDLSDDADMPPDKPAFSGLFRPSLFKSLLHKAKLATNMADPAPQVDQPGPSQQHEALFTTPKPATDFIPCPQLFSEVVQRSWSTPSSLPAPSGLDKKLYCSAPSLQDLLQLPTVDAPVANLTASSVISNDVADGLRSEDRKAEFTFRRTHNAAAWAVKAATSASFFSRACLIWLRQLHERLPPADSRLRQDVNKLVAATEYTADASLNAAKFALRALVSSVTSRRLLWLKNWRADAKSRWRLASTPYKGSRLFGEALDPILVEDKDKRKVMPSSYRRADRKPSSYSTRQPFRNDAGPSGSFSSRPYSQGFDRSFDRPSFRDRGRKASAPKRPFRGTGSRTFRRGK
ncbi:uncharacterized protein [Pituophis catenifer annectens]|uniref:uncharacterized protein n=1 Tax=Pituophis catenifer annectens TaxID=94852 RepID=UPI003992B6DF